MQHVPSWLVPLLSILLVILGTTTGSAQKLKSKYNLKKLQIGFQDGKTKRCRLVEFTLDSIVIQDKNVAPPGTLVSILHRYKDRRIKAKVEQVSETSLIVTRIENNALLKVERADIVELIVFESPLSEEALAKYQKRSIHYSSIKFLAMHRKGAGGIGFAVGFAAAAALFFSPSVEEGNVFIYGLGMFAAICVTPIIATSNKNLMVDGDREKFLHVRERILRRQIEN